MDLNSTFVALRRHLEAGSGLEAGISAVHQSVGRAIVFSTVALVIGLLYTLPNFYGESPAVQVSSAMSTVRIETAMLDRVREILDENKISHEGVYFEQNGPTGTVRARFDSTDTQLQARDLIETTALQHGRRGMAGSGWK